MHRGWTQNYGFSSCGSGSGESSRVLARHLHGCAADDSNTLPLHGSAVEIDGKAYAFLGDSERGNRRLAAAFVSEGYRLVSDDVIAVTLAGGGGMPVVAPSYPQQKLWQESLDHLGMNMERRELSAGLPGNREIRRAGGHSILRREVPLAGAFELVKSQAEESALDHCRILNGFASCCFIRTGTD